jgi:hypothetical protein
VEVRWRSFFRSTSLGKWWLLATLHPLLENVLQTDDHFEISCLSELPFHGWKSPEIAWGRDLDCMADILMGFHRSTFSKPKTEFNSHLAPCDCWTFPTMKMELRGKKFRSHQRSAARSRSGWSVVRIASLFKGGTSKKRPSPHLHKVPTRSNKVSPRTLQTALLMNKMLLYCASVL